MLSPASPEFLHTHLQIMIVEHRDLDDAINRLTVTSAQDEFLLRRLKKRKLLLKDRIAQLERLLEPDTPA